MLSPSSPTQKSQRKEDNSGSDAGSEVGPELETDRFGFIVNNGHEAGSVGPPPERVRQREAKWINIIFQWDQILSKKTDKVKVQCQKGIPASLRAKCWPLLCGATDRMKQNKTVYQYLDSQPALQTWVDVIRRDLDRQFPFHEMFLSKDGHGQRGLFQVLKAYTQYHPDEGYCQAQGPVAAVLLMNMPAEEAFWCLVQISEEYLPGYYSPLLEGVLFDAALLTWVLKKTSPAAHNHLQRHGVEPLMFATDWLMCLFTRHLPFNTLLRVWDLFFCHGVRVLFQVAVVLVCRVLGRAEQRKRCQGQMETLEKLRGVRQQVKEEEDSFIAEVCSVPLSARDVERQTEKELEKWRKDRPSSTFDPRVRCQGYQMAWAKIRKKEEEQNREEREKWNLSIPLARSASTLSLSPYVLQRMVRKDRKGNIGEWQGGNKVVRHLSLGAKEDCRSWTVSRHKEIKGGRKEDKRSGERKKLTGQTELTEPKRMENIPNIETDQVEGETEGVEITIRGKEEGQQPEEHKILSEITEETDEEEEPPPASSKDQNVETFLQLAAHATEEVDSYIQSQVLEQQGPKSNDTEISNKSKETERQKVEKEIRTETENDTEAETNTEQQMLMVPEVGVVEISTFKEPTVQTETQEKEMTEEDSTEGKHNRTESVSEPDIGEGCNAQTATEMNEQTPLVALKEPAAPRSRVEEVIVQTDAEPHKDPETLTLCSHEGNNPEEGSDPVADIENEAEIPVSEDTAWESCSKECDALASKPTCDIERLLAANLDGTQALETESGRNEEMSEVTSTQRKAINFISAPDCRMSSGELSTSEELEPEHQKTQAKMEALDEEESTTRGDQITSTDPKDTHVPERESQLVQGFLTQASRHRCSRSSGDYCIRKSSSYSGPRLGRRISEELFTVPHKSNQSQSIPNPSEVKHTVFQTNTSLNQTQPDLNPSSVDTVSLSAKTPEWTEVEQKSSDRPKSVGLFYRLRRNQPKNNDSKGEPKLLIPQILIQDFSNGHGRKVIADEVEEKLSSRERRKRRREQERRDKEEEKLRRRREKELEKAKEREGKRSQMRELQGEKGRKVERQDAKICSQKIKLSASHADSYF